MKHVMIKQLRNLPLKKELYPLLYLSTFSIALWFGGPLIAIANHVPFEQPAKRIYLILLALSAWVLKIYLFDGKPRENVVAFVPVNTEEDKKVQTLTEKFQGFVAFLNKTFINKDGHDVSLNQLPWYLFIGGESSGKTTLLANANVNFVLAKKFKPENLKNISPSNSSDWWVTRDMVLVDVPSAYLQSNPNRAASSHSVWHSLLNLIAGRGKRPLAGVVLAVALADLLHLQKPNREVPFKLKQQIHELRAQFGAHLPFYLIITKCDILPGFTEFFSDSGIDELSQAWGITMPALKENESLSLTSVFTHRFNALIKRLNKQLISRLHQERNSLMRPHIKDFPLHIERLKECVVNALTEITSVEKNFHLQGVYLTSAVQQHAEEHLVHLYAAAASNKALPAIQTLNMPSRPYFVRQLLLQGFTNMLHAAPAAKKWQHRPLIYSLSVMMTLTISIFIAADFRINVKQTNDIRSGLIQYQNSVKREDYDINGAMPLLNALEARAHPSVDSWLFHSAKTRKHAMNAYHDALHNIIFSGFKTPFETYLQTTDYKNPAMVYMVLKAYLELGDKQYFQSDFVLNALQEIAPGTFTGDADKLMKHINAAFHDTFQPLSLDDQLITNVRKHLATLPAVTLSFLILKNMDGNTTPVALPLTDAGTKDKIHVSRMFTGAVFQNIYDTQVENAALELVQGNWILGSNLVNPAQQNFALIADQLRSAYISSYAGVWENLLVNTQLSVPTNLEDTDAIAASLIGENSPLLAVIKVIKQNTQFKPVMNVSPKLAAIDNLQNNSLTAITLTLKQLHNDLQKILTAHNLMNAAYQAAAERFQDYRNQAADPITQLHVLAKNHPEPIRGWLNTLATQSWRFTLQNAALYAENHWQTDVMSAYHTQFENHYPLWANAGIETPLDQFSKFLNPKGTLNNYFQDFLQPFVEVKNKQWQWKKMDDEQIPFSDVALGQISQALALQSIFFPDNNNQIFLKFTLQPMSLEKDVQSISLNINGQMLGYDRSQPHIAQSLSWPGSKMTHATTLNFLDRDNHSSDTKLEGSWAWFRLVNQSATRILNTHELLLNFAVNGHEAKYYLFTKGDVNPFFALQKIRLPEQLKAKA
jgi:type VI secretion system protein ImpL